MRILHVLNHARNGNGNVEVAIDLACEQAAAGASVTLAASKNHFEDELARSGVRAVTLRAQGLAARVAEAGAIVRSFEPDVIHAHMVGAAMLGRAAAPRDGPALVTTVHNSFDRQAPLMGVGDRVIAVSDAVRGQMRARGIPERKLRTVRNGVIGGRRRSALPACRRALPRPCIATVAGLHARKGIDDLIDAFVLLLTERPDLTLVLIGDGPDRPRLEARVARLGIAERVLFLGFVRDPREYLAAVDVFVLASRAEPFGLVLIEARQMGCPVVATNVGGIPEALDGGGAGMLVPPRRPADLARAVGHLMSDDAVRAAWRARARAGIEDHGVARMARETSDVYAEAVEAKQAVRVRIRRRAPA